MNMAPNIPKLDLRHFRKIYEGAYIYQKDKTIFSEEKFEVFRNKEKMSVLFTSELFSRTMEGVLFQARVSYLMSKEYTPQLVITEKKMGKDNALEVFDFIEKRSIIEYQFITGSSKETREIKTPTKFQVATPAGVCSHTFTLSKKFDTTNLNYYSILKSENKWNFEQTPKFIEIGARRTSETPISFKIDKHRVKALTYTVFDIDEGEHEKEHIQKEGLSVKISPYYSIPYVIQDLDGSTAQIKTLKNLLSEET